ncbi:hypothetical protein IMSAGC005_02358 [Lachnospiraceae bacterium]|nr:hypothetical protein IMSAGC005_02358 [Lachnospiraceae bacterium]
MNAVNVFELGKGAHGKKKDSFIHATEKWVKQLTR